MIVGHLLFRKEIPMPYEFSGLYLFGTPLPAIDEETLVSPAQAAALKRALVEMGAVEMRAPAEETAPLPPQES
jgi:hypothetical protein